MTVGSKSGRAAAPTKTGTVEPTPRKCSVSEQSKPQKSFDDLVVGSVPPDDPIYQQAVVSLGQPQNPQPPPPEEEPDYSQPNPHPRFSGD